MTEPLPLALLLVLIPLVIVVAGAYASVGLGGGTGYLAIMTLVGMSGTVMTPTVLLLNILVTGVAFMRFGLAGRLRWKLFLPFLLPAMPAAFIGGIVTANQKIFLTVLAIVLTVTAIAMFRTAPNGQDYKYETDRGRVFAIAIPAGLIIGFLSGFLGIGGGVFLGPLILFLGWADPKQAAAMNSALILMLSIIALVAHGIKGKIELSLVIPLGIAALIGGLGGATLAEKKLSPLALQRVFAVIVLIAAMKAVYDVISN